MLATEPGSGEPSPSGAAGAAAEAADHRSGGGGWAAGATWPPAAGGAFTEADVEDLRLDGRSFALGAVLGEGGFSTVHVATHTSGKRCAAARPARSAARPLPARARRRPLSPACRAHP